MNNFNFSDFLNEFSGFLETILTAPGHLIITGDFNIHIDDIQDNNSQKFLDLITSFGLINHVNQPTHDRGHILDLMLTREADPCISAVNVDFSLPSDHAAIHAITRTKKPASSKSTMHHRNLKALNVSALKDTLKPAFDSFTTIADINTMANYYREVVQKTLDELAPVQMKSMVNKPRPQWFTVDLIHERQKLRSLERQWLKSGLSIHKQLFVAARSDYKTLIDNTKSKYFQAKIADTNDDKQLFKIVDEISGSKKIVANVIPDSDISLLPELFADFFENKIVQIRSNLENSIVDSVVVNNNSDDALPVQIALNSFHNVTVEEVIKIVRSMNSKSCALDPVPTSLVKDCLEIWAPVLTLIVNNSFQSGVFPEECKSAIVRPLIKKPDLDRNVLKNYRPVSNCSFLDKFLEKCAFKQLNQYFSCNSLYGNFQSAYREGHGTETALLKVHNDIMLALDNRLDVVLVMLDLSAAFDTIDHTILIDRLQTRFQIGGKALSWIRSFLCGRSQRVSVGGSIVSKARTLKFGVPQGSVLGPVLFSLYVTPLEDIIVKHQCQTVIFADDTQLYITCKNSNSISILESCIDEIRKWMRINFLALNDTKTEVICFSSRYVRSLNQSSITHVRIGEVDIGMTSVVRNLGVMFDNKGTMSQHVVNICKSASYSLWRISKIRHLLDMKSTEKLVHAFVTCRLDYCNSVLFGIPDYQLRKIQNIQNSAARLVCRFRLRDTKHVTPILKSLHWLPVKVRIQFKLLCIVFKCIYLASSPLYLKELIVINSRNYMSLRSDTGVTLKRPLPSKTKSYGDRAFLISAPSLWNALPTALRSITNFENFKTKLKTHLFGLYYNS